MVMWVTFCFNKFIYLSKFKQFINKPESLIGNKEKTVENLSLKLCCNESVFPLKDAEHESKEDV